MRVVLLVIIVPRCLYVTRADPKVDACCSQKSPGSACYILAREQREPRGPDTIILDRTLAHDDNKDVAEKWELAALLCYGNFGTFVSCDASSGQL